jgi:hypothetical protein
MYTVRPKCCRGRARSAELLTGDKTRKAITFHDLRATGITWMAIRGDEPIKIMRRAGHENMSTTMGYVREAENLTTAIGEPFPALPEPIVSPDESPEGPAQWAKLRERTWEIQRPQRDSTSMVPEKSRGDRAPAGAGGGRVAGPRASSARVTALHPG